jgi:hypothetical protein
MSYDGGDFVDSTSTKDARASYFPIWAEESVAMTSAGNREWSYGNGSVGNIGIVLPFDCVVEFATFQAEIFGTSINLDIQKNGADTGVITFTGGQDSVELANPISFSAGEMIGFRTTGTVGTYTDGRVTAWLRRA